MRTPRRLGAALVAVLAALSIGFAAGCSDDDDGGDTTTAAAPPATPPPATTPPATTPPADTSTAPVDTSTAPPDTDTAPVDTSTAPAGQVIEIPADETALAFAVEEATASAGSVTLSMPNPSPLPHNIALEDPPIEGEVVDQGGVSEITAELEAGEYVYYCSVPGHREAGMEGTLTVE